MILPSREHLKSQAILFLGVYILFILSISISIFYTEHTYFHRYIFNDYVAGKIFFESLKYSVILFITTNIFNQLFYFLNIYKNHDGIDIQDNYFKIKNHIFLDVLIFILFTIIAIPIKTVITSFYADKYSTYFKLAFVDFNTETKIIFAIIIIITFILYINRKYKFAIRNLIILILLIIIPTGYFIWSTQSKNFDAQDANISKMAGTALFLGGNLTDEITGLKMKPEAEKLFRMASNDIEKATAYYWLAVVELKLNNGVKALNYIDKSISLDSTSGEYSMKSAIQRNLQNFIGARASAEKCLSIAIEKKLPIKQAMCEDTIAGTYIDEGEITFKYLNKESFINAKKHLENAILLNPEQSYYKLDLNRVIIDEAISDFYSDNIETAISKMDKFLENTDSYKDAQLISRAYVVRGDAKIYLGEYTSGLKDLEKALEVYKGEAKAIYTDMALTYETMEDINMAIMFYDKALSEKSERNYPLNSYILENKNRALKKL